MRLGRILIEKGYITPEQLEEALNEQQVAGETLDEVLIRKKWVDYQKLDKVLSAPEARIFDIGSYIVDSEAIKLIPEDLAIKYRVIPVLKKAGVLSVAMADVNQRFVIEELKRITGLEIEVMLADEEDIFKVIAQCYGSSEAIQKIIRSLGTTKVTQVEHVEEGAQVVELVDSLIQEAVKANASDIHFEPEGEVVRVRYRIDGMLYYHHFLPKYLGPLVTSRLKVLGNLDIAERRMPQDGRIIMKVGTKEIDLRISTCPTFYGENVVLRILDKSSMIVGFSNLGFSPEDTRHISKLLKNSTGIVLVTGPTGSGKTTTLYNFLHRINSENVNIMTIEDPIEYQFLLIRQAQINPKKGFSFATGLRSFLRQDPDVIMVGEIRDSETAEIAVQAALTGHLVLSSFHTNDASVAFPRLINMGIEPFFVSDSVRGIIAQRLVRKVCPFCRQSYKPSSQLIRLLRLEDKVDEHTSLVRAKGCEQCRNTGYLGRTGIFEFLRVTPAIQTLVVNSASAEEILKTARNEGMKTLREVAIEKMFAGITTAEEVIRMT